LVLAFAFLVAAVAAGVLLTVESGIDRLLVRVRGSSERTVESVSRENRVLAESLLVRYAREIVQGRARQAGAELAYLLRGRDCADYAALRRDPELRRIATQEIEAIYPGRHRAGYIDVGDDRGVSIWHPNPDIEGRNFAEWKDRYPQMWDLVSRSFTEPETAGEYLFVDGDNREREKYMVSRRVPGTPFIVYAVVNIGEFFAPVIEAIDRKGEEVAADSNLRIAALLDEFEDGIKKGSLLLGGLFVVLGGAAGWWLAFVISRPIVRLSRAVGRLGGGDFTVALPPGGTSEVRDLTAAFNQLGSRLKSYMRNLAREIAAREAVESEIKIARGLQESLLPRAVPVFPGAPAFDLHAVNLPAREVAGDFYDFFPLDSRRLALVIADVSGKGVPASIFMAVTRTLVRDFCPRSPDPASVLAEVNNALCRDNERSMFVTMILAFYDVDAGGLVFANAGHDRLFLVRGNGAVESGGLLGNMALGVTADYAYANGNLDLAAGESLVFYTDGVTEARNGSGEFFGAQRLERLLAAHAGESAEALCASVRAAVLAFQPGPLFDDVTIMTLTRRGA